MEERAKALFSFCIDLLEMCSFMCYNLKRVQFLEELWLKKVLKKNIDYTFD